MRGWVFCSLADGEPFQRGYLRLEGGALSLWRDASYDEEVFRIPTACIRDRAALGRRFFVVTHVMQPSFDTADEGTASAWVDAISNAS